MNLKSRPQIPNMTANILHDPSCSPPFSFFPLQISFPASVPLLVLLACLPLLVLLACLPASVPLLVLLACLPASVPLLVLLACLPASVPLLVLLACLPASVPLLVLLSCLPLPSDLIIVPLQATQGKHVSSLASIMAANRK
jgi:hypothetical protein